MRRPIRQLAVAIAVTSAFGAGIGVGFVADHQHRSRGTVVDEAAARIAASAANPIRPSDLDSAAVEAMLAKLGDKWAAYYAAGDYAQLKALLDGRYSGLGVWLRRSATGQTLVASVLPDSPAALSGLAIGDQLLSVNGITTKGADLGSIVSRLRGPSGTTVRLVISRNAQTEPLALRRASVQDNDVQVGYVAPGVARIRVAAFTKGVGAQVSKAVAALHKANARGVVLDLRGNPGGLLEEAVAVAGAFLDGGVVVSYTKRGEPTQVLSAPKGGDTLIPLAVLVDGGTASAAEVVTGALQDRGRAIIVGAQTFGKGSVQQPIRLSDGSAIEITVGRYLTPHGRSLDGKGLAPDILLPGDVDEAIAVRRAVDVLQGLVADASTATQTGRG